MHSGFRQKILDNPPKMNPIEDYEASLINEYIDC